MVVPTATPTFHAVTKAFDGHGVSREIGEAFPVSEMDPGRVKRLIEQRFLSPSPAAETHTSDDGRRWTTRELAEKHSAPKHKKGRDD